ncbi:MAG: choice-of-anchor Q domain-containing protein [Thermomicrobiales bacterium]
MTGSTINGNTADAGGGIYNSFGIVTATNATVSGNTATHFGGGIATFAPAILTYMTVANNTTGIYASVPGSPITVASSLFSNIGANCTAANTIASGDNNLSSDGSCGTFTQPHDRTYRDPHIGVLANNGGPTLTHALLSGSPAIDAGGTSANGCPATDQRGFPRPQGAACDIGAFEFLAPPPPAPRPSNGPPAESPVPPMPGPRIGPSMDGSPLPLPSGR